MISDFVTLASSTRNDLGMFPDIFPNHKKSCLDMVSRKDIKQPWGQGRAGPIVKSHSDVGAIDMNQAERDTRFRPDVSAGFTPILPREVGFGSKPVHGD